MKKIIISLMLVICSLGVLMSQNLKLEFNEYCPECTNVHGNVLEDVYSYMFNVNDDLKSKTINKLDNVVNYQVEVHYSDDLNNFLLQDYQANIFNLDDLSKLKTDSIKWDVEYDYIKSIDSLTGSVSYVVLCVDESERYSKKIIINVGGVNGELSNDGPKTIKVIFTHPFATNDEYFMFDNYGIFE